MADEEDRYPTFTTAGRVVRRTADLLPTPSNLVGAAGRAYMNYAVPAAMSLGRGLFGAPGAGVPTGGGEGGTLAQRGYPTADMTALERAQALPPGRGGIEYLPEADVARERRVMESGGVGRAPTPEAPIKEYGPDDAWAYRERIRGGAAAGGGGFIPQGVGGKPGERIINEYGPGFGGSGGTTRVMATADKTGRFNQFSDVPGARAATTAPPDPYGINADLAASRQRAAIHRGTPGIVGKIFAAGEQRRQNALRQSAFQQGSLDVARGNLGVHQEANRLARDKARPDIALANARNLALEKLGPDAMAAIMAGLRGHSTVMATPTSTGVAYRRPEDVPPGGGFMPTLPGMTAPEFQPTLPRPDMNLSQYDYEY